MSELATLIAEAGLQGHRIVADSRVVMPGDVFLAQRGLSVDGHEFIAAAVARGAAAIIAEAAPDGLGVPVFIAPTGDAGVVAAMLDAHYGQPSRRLAITGVTGTNGKTSVTQWIAAALSADGEPCAVIGTLGVAFAGEHRSTSNTTPDLVTTYSALAELAGRGARSVAMEVSSHALDQRRVEGIGFSETVFTNLTPDHLDYHGTMEAYGRAKARLFEDYAARTRIVNIDDPFGERLTQTSPGPWLTYGFGRGDLRAEAIEQHPSGQRFRLIGLDTPAVIETPVAGRFNIYNLLAVAAVLAARGRSAVDIARLLSALAPVRGRMQRVTPAGVPGPAALPRVYVDYAHTPDALDKALVTLAEQTTGRLWVVFGCGGNRDRSKRPLMGRIAATRAGQVVVTSDNPRFESPEAIIADIVAGVDHADRSRLHIEPDRAAAIAQAIAQADPEDVVLIAGKGHETYQESAGERRHFDDAEEAQAALTARLRCVQAGAVRV